MLNWDKVKKRNEEPGNLEAQGTRQLALIGWMKKASFGAFKDGKAN